MDGDKIKFANGLDLIQCGTELHFPLKPNLSTEQWLPEIPVKAPDYKLNDVSEIPPHRMEQMKEHFAKLKKKFPHMKDNRIAKKTANYFKIKLV